MEIYESLIEALELAADLLELTEEVVDLPCDGVDLRLESDLLLRFAPFRAGLCGYQLILSHKILPLGINAHDVGNDALHQRERAIGFREGEKLVRHLPHHNSLDFFGVRDESDDFLVPVQDDDSRSHVVIRRIHLPGDLEPLELSVGFHNGRIGASMVGR